MLSVIPIAEALSLVLEKFSRGAASLETVSLEYASGKFLGADITAEEDLPAFNRSTVDGFAVRSADLLGCSDSIPAILEKTGELFKSRIYLKKYEIVEFPIFIK